MADDRKRRWYVAEDGTRMARPCPNCHHTKCGPNCTCDCDARFGEEDADAEMARLRARVAELEAAQQWRPMSEAPACRFVGEDPVILLFPDGARRAGFRAENGQWHCAEDHYRFLVDPIGWLPLPAAPKEVEL